MDRYAYREVLERVFIQGSPLEVALDQHPFIEYSEAKVLYEQASGKFDVLYRFYTTVLQNDSDTMLVRT